VFQNLLFTQEDIAFVLLHGVTLAAISHLNIKFTFLPSGRGWIRRRIIAEDHDTAWLDDSGERAMLENGAFDPVPFPCAWPTR
jgi:hypothetical protein